MHSDWQMCSKKPSKEILWKPYRLSANASGDVDKDEMSMRERLVMLCMLYPSSAKLDTVHNIQKHLRSRYCADPEAP